MSDELSIDQILREAFPDVDAADSRGYFEQVGDTFLALAFSSLFWPRFIEVHGAVFVVFGEGDEQEVRRRLATPRMREGASQDPFPWVEMVNSFNWFEISQFFSRWRGPRDLVYPACRKLGEILREAWRAKLRRDFPEMTFNVALVGSDEDRGLRLEVTQVSPALREPAGWDPYLRIIR